MPPAHSFWVIVHGTVPTAFRARHREDLLPTLVQLQHTQPDVSLVWFESGRTWESPEVAREALEARRRLARERKPTWRPGGSHVDPREKYKRTRDQKRARFKERAKSHNGPPADGETPRDRPRRPGGRPLFKEAGFSGSRKPVGRSGRTWKPKGPPRRGHSPGPRGPRGPKGPKSRS
jgi:hypothetical protein